MSGDDDENVDIANVVGVSAFGVKAATTDLDAAYARTKRNVKIDTEDALPKRTRKDQASDEDSIEDSSDEDELAFPTSHEIVLEKHTRVVSGLTIDPSGSRIVSGGHDSQVAFWDFSGMGAIPRPFKILEPFESHQMRSVDFNSTGELLVLAAANWQPKIVDREGADVGEMPRGDPYLRDMKNTRGHVGEVASAAWNPRVASQCITSSADATIRLWDATNANKCLQVLVHKPLKAGAGKVKCTVAKYAADAKTIGGAYVDGTISLWATDGPWHRPMGGVIPNAHEPGTETTDLAFSLNGYSMASRGSDSVKLWDRRNFKSAVATFDHLPNRYQETSLIFSPNNQEILTPTSTGSQASLQVMSSTSLQPLTKIPLDSPAIRVIYHARINQIITSHANGSIHVLYSPEHSTRGAKLVLSRAPKARHIDDLMTADVDESAGEVRPNDAALLGQSSSRIRNMARKDPKRSNMPELPGTSRFAERKVVGEMAKFRDSDPQKELLKYDEAAKKDPRFFGIYQKTQPVPQFADLEDFADEKEKETPANKRFKFTPKDKK